MFFFLLSSNVEEGKFTRANIWEPRVRERMSRRHNIEKAMSQSMKKQITKSTATNNHQ